MGVYSPNEIANKSLGPKTSFPTQKVEIQVYTLAQIWPKKCAHP